MFHCIKLNCFSWINPQLCFDVLFQPGSIYSAKLIEETVKLSMNSDDDITDGSRQSHKFVNAGGLSSSRGKGDGEESTDYMEPRNAISSKNYVVSPRNVPDGFELHLVRIDKELEESLGMSLIPCGDYMKGHFKVIASSCFSFLLRVLETSVFNLSRMSAVQA